MTVSEGDCLMTILRNGSFQGWACSCCLPSACLAQGSDMNDTNMLLGLADVLLNPAGCAW